MASRTTGPLKAYKPYKLNETTNIAGSSGGNNLPELRSKMRRSPDHRHSPSEGSPSSTLKGDKAKANRQGIGSSDGISRTASLDTIAVPYLNGYSPRLSEKYYNSQRGVYVADKGTQTSVHKRSSSLGTTSSDGKGSSSKKTYHGNSPLGTKRSPIPSPPELLTNPISLYSGTASGSLTAASGVKPSTASPMSVDSEETFRRSNSKPVRIPNRIPSNEMFPRLKNSVESANQEVANFVSDSTYSQPNSRMLQMQVEGHVAPVRELEYTEQTKSVDTQTLQIGVRFGVGDCDELLDEFTQVNQATFDEFETGSGGSSNENSSSPSPIVFGPSEIMDPSDIMNLSTKKNEVPEVPSQKITERGEPEGCDGYVPVADVSPQCFISKLGRKVMSRSCSQPETLKPPPQFLGPFNGDSGMLGPIRNNGVLLPSKFSAFVPFDKYYRPGSFKSPSGQSSSATISGASNLAVSSFVPTTTNSGMVVSTGI